MGGEGVREVVVWDGIEEKTDIMAKNCEMFHSISHVFSPPYYYGKGWRGWRYLVREKCVLDRVIKDKSSSRLTEPAIQMVKREVHVRKRRRRREITIEMKSNMEIGRWGEQRIKTHTTARKLRK